MTVKLWDSSGLGPLFLLRMFSLRAAPRGLNQSA